MECDPRGASRVRLDRDLCSIQFLVACQSDDPGALSYVATGVDGTLVEDWDRLHGVDGVSRPGRVGGRPSRGESCSSADDRRV